MSPQLNSWITDGIAYRFMGISNGTPSSKPALSGQGRRLL